MDKFTKHVLTNAKRDEDMTEQERTEREARRAAIRAQILADQAKRK
jgi:hypothetical protein